MGQRWQFYMKNIIYLNLFVYDIHTYGPTHQVYGWHPCLCLLPVYSQQSMLQDGP